MITLKIQQFLELMKETIMNTPDIHLRTYKLFLSLFGSNLSKKEFERWNKDIVILLNIDTVQLSMKSAYEIAKKKGLLNDKGERQTINGVYGKFNKKNGD